jgi:hypothetical protein
MQYALAKINKQDVENISRFFFVVEFSNCLFFL